MERKEKVENSNQKGFDVVYSLEKEKNFDKNKGKRNEFTTSFDKLDNKKERMCLLV